jgi:hypothetical protein
MLGGPEDAEAAGFVDQPGREEAAAVGDIDRDRDRRDSLGEGVIHHGRDFALDGEPDQVGEGMTQADVGITERRHEAVLAVDVQMQVDLDAEAGVVVQRTPPDVQPDGRPPLRDPELLDREPASGSAARLWLKRPARTWRISVIR